MDAANLAASPAAVKADAFVSAHEVLCSEDLFATRLFPCLDGASKRALRGVSHAMRRLIDALVTVVASSSAGASSDQLRSALFRWPCVRHLTLLNVSSADEMVPLSTTTVTGMESLTVRQVGRAHAHDTHGAWCCVPFPRTHGAACVPFPRTHA
jgi:hypothetical protein